MMGRLLASRWKHLLRLVPLGALVGLAFGLLFQDVVYGLLVGCSLGALLGLLFAVRNPS
jgi:uncharacterized membrane protein